MVETPTPKAPVQGKEAPAAAAAAQPVHEEPKVYNINGALIHQVLYQCENEKCQQSFASMSRSCPLGCPFCHGGVYIAGLLCWDRLPVAPKAAEEPEAAPAAGGPIRRNAPPVVR